MAVTIKPIVFVGRKFTNEPEGLAFFRSKIELTEDDLDEMGPHLHYWLEPRMKKGYPACGLFSIWRGDENCGYYIGYQVFDIDPQKMKEKIDQSVELWSNLFKEKAEIVQAVLYS